mmetsp:Transcript_688/g.674  ORF Transcript_688/g.674 Transcript_688/m.674 type:complete len:116 (+) Transcript_688:966-1313(+)
MVFLENKMFQNKDGVNPVDLFDMKYQKGKKKAEAKIREEYKIVEPEFKYSLKESATQDLSVMAFPNEIKLPIEELAGNLCKADQTEKVDKQRVILDGIITYTREQHILVCWILLW